MRCWTSALRIGASLPELESFQAHFGVGDVCNGTAQLRKWRLVIESTCRAAVWCVHGVGVAAGDHTEPHNRSPATGRREAARDNASQACAALQPCASSAARAAGSMQRLQKLKLMRHGRGALLCCAPAAPPEAHVSHGALPSRSMAFLEQSEQLAGRS